MNLLVVGTLALDSVKTPYGERENILGGSASFAAICASYFCPVQTVGIIGSDFPTEHMELFQSKNIDTKDWSSARCGKMRLITTGRSNPLGPSRRPNNISAIPPVASRPATSYRPTISAVCDSAAPISLELLG